jgi:hypothetical protein
LCHRDAGDERQHDRQETPATKFTAFAQFKAFLLKKAAQYDRRFAHRLTMIIEEMGEAAPPRRAAPLNVAGRFDPQESWAQP